MARLLIKTEGLENRTLELRLGVNRVGRDPDCDFPIIHPTVSTNHCELVVTGVGVMLRDCNSTNGTFLNGDPVREAWLLPGQEVKLGDVELFVESTEVNVAVQTNVGLDLTKIAERLVHQFDHEPNVKARIAQALMEIDNEPGA